MASVNRVTLLGNLGRDPEMRQTQEGVAICNIALATSQSWKDKQTGQRKQNTEWHRVVLFNRLAEVAGEYLRKGSSVYFEGKLRTRKWTSDDGRDNYTTEILVDQMQMLGERDNQPARQQSSSRQANQPRQQSGQQRREQSSAPSQQHDDYTDDIPF